MIRKSRRRETPGGLAVSMRAQLVPIAGGTPIEVAKDMTLVGRGEECDVRLEHKSVSKIHCVIVKTDGLMLVRDLGSTNGTRVNGTRVRRGMLLPNDKISVANFHFRILFGAALQSAAASEKTQQINADELEKLRGKAHAMVESDADMELPMPLEIQANSLPDVYPEDPQKQKKNA
jgi:predicted component of type VI protein secretion system